MVGFGIPDNSRPCLGFRGFRAFRVWGSGLEAERFPFMELTGFKSTLFWGPVALNPKQLNPIPVMPPVTLR